MFNRGELAPNLVPNILTQARWIWPEDPHWDMHNCYAQFRRSFALKAVPSKAPLFVTADQSYQLFINGTFVCRGPARGFQSHWPYDEVDVASFLRRGKNVLAIRAHNPGFSNFQYLTQGFAGLLLGAQWGALKIVSDRSWRMRRQSGVSKDTVPTSLQLFCQEHIDLRVESDQWTEVDFDDDAWLEASPDGSPSPAGPAWNAMPWHSLEERQIPLLDEKKFRPKKLLGANHGQCAPGYERVRDVTLLRHGEGLEHRATEASIHPLIAQATGKNKFRSYLIDFEKTVVGNLTIVADGCCGDEIIDTLHTETIDIQNLEPHLVIPTHCRMAFGNRLVCHEGRTSHDFYHPFGFRYLVLTVRNSTKPLTIDVTLNWLGYPLERKGGFQSSDSTLEKIWETCAWTQQCCSLDAYVDTPWREQAQWWGDARVQAWNTFHMNGDARLFRRGIGCIAGQTAPNGLTYGHAPTMAHNCILPDFTLIWMLTLWDYYWQTESLEPFLAHQETIANALSYFEVQTDSKVGLVSYDPRYWLFLDWTGIFKEGYPTLLNLWLMIALEKLEALFRVAGQPAKAKPIEQWRRRLGKALTAMIDKNGLLHDGRKPDGKIVSNTSVHTQTLAIVAQLDPGSEASMIKRILDPYIREEIKPEVAPSAYWITYVFSVLAERGRGMKVLDFIKKYWTPMAEHGTTWEVFNPRPGDFSHSHAWSAHPLFHLMQIIGGIRQTKPGWKEIQFSPFFHGDSGGAWVPSPRGEIRSQWRRVGGKVEVQLSLPEGVRARVCLPANPERWVTGTQAWEIPAASPPERRKR